jgi:hypothetical protein
MIPQNAPLQWEAARETHFGVSFTKNWALITLSQYKPPSSGLSIRAAHFSTLPKNTMKPSLKVCFQGLYKPI